MTERRAPNLEATTQREIMLAIARMPSLSLSQKQIEELKDIAEDYDGALHPDTFKRIIENYPGVSREQAEIAKERYWMKLVRARERMLVTQALTVDREVLSPQDLYNLAQEIGLINRFFDKVILTACEEEVEVNPHFRKQIVDKAITAIKEEVKSNPFFRKQIVDKAVFFIDKAIAEGATEEEKGEKEERTEMKRDKTQKNDFDGDLVMFG